MSADAQPDRALLTWFAGGAPSLTAAVYRRTASTDWQQLATIAADGTGRLRYEDRDVIPGVRYAYRLGYHAGGVEAFTAEAWLDIPVAFALALYGLRPNPAQGEFVVSFSLPTAGPATLEVLDLGGRRILSHEMSSIAAGRHLLRVEEARNVPTGVYWLRLRQGGRTVTARGVVVRWAVRVALQWQTRRLARGAPCVRVR